MRMEWKEKKTGQVQRIQNPKDEIEEDLKKAHLKN